MKKIKKEKVKKESILNVVTLSFLFLLPIFSTTYFHNNYTTLFEVIMICLIFLATLLIFTDSRKNSKYIFLYYLLCLIYLFINYFRADNFYSLVPGNFNYNVFEEFTTLLKLMMPITFLYSLYYQKIEYKKYLLVLKVWVVLICGSIIITNLFKISLSSYSERLITKNIFEWNINNYYQETASKGLFMYANQEAVIMLLMLLVFVYDSIYKNKKSLIYLFLLVISMLMLGTRVSAVGGFLTLICAYLFYIIYCLYKKEKFNKSSLFAIIIIIFWGGLLPISPYANRSIELSTVQGTNEEDVINTEDIKKAYNIEDNLKKNVQDENFEIAYVYNNYNPNYLPKVFFEEYYPIEYDYKFWYDFVKNTSIYDMNYRLIEESIIQRVVKVNDNPFDVFFGISNVRIQNIVNIERDFVLHYYSFGIIGSFILLFIYLLMLVYGIYTFFKYQTYYLFIMATVVVLFLFSAFLTGNIINSINAIIPFTFIASGIFNSKKLEK